MSTMRKPIYAKSQPYRLVSRPNGLWRAERKVSDQRGVNATPKAYRKGRKLLEQHFDPWSPVCRDCELEIARTFMPKEQV